MPPSPIKREETALEEKKDEEDKQNAAKEAMHTTNEEEAKPEPIDSAGSVQTTEENEKDKSKSNY